jgi:predicted HTH domain antitoxin
MKGGVSVGDMGAVQIDLPSDLVLAARLNEGDVSQEVAKVIALELFRQDKVSMSRAAELCRTPLEAFMQFAADHVVALQYGVAELEEAKCAR